MRFAHLLAGTALVAAALPAFAQQTAATSAAAESEDTIVVTGSRIPRPQYEGTIPGVQIEAKDIESRGFTSVLEALNDQPLAGPGASPIGNAGGQPASLGAAFVDLLDLGTARTLTLVNGRRFISGNAGSLFVAANATGGQVDLNVIPTALTERIDTLTVGGAVAYGSDAIAGVVNVILKDDFEGFRATARTGVTSKNDAFNYEISSIYGVNFADDRGNIAASFQYNHDDGLQGNEREDYGASYIAPTFFGNGAVRNTRFAPSATINVTTDNNGAFLRAADDGQPGNTILPLVTGGSVLLSPGGNVFQFLGTLPTPTGGAPLTGANFNGGVAGNQVGATQSLAGNTQLIPGVPVGSATANGLNGNIPSVGGAGLAPNTFTRFAPSALPAGTTAAQVVTALAPTFSQAGVSAAALNTLAINLLQANRPTPR
jgi:outer membrane receptor protein involved in Fe transport